MSDSEGARGWTLGGLWRAVPAIRVGGHGWAKQCPSLWPGSAIRRTQASRAVVRITREARARRNHRGSWSRQRGRSHAVRSGSDRTKANTRGPPWPPLRAADPHPMVQQRSASWTAPNRWAGADRSRQHAVAATHPATPRRRGWWDRHRRISLMPIPFDASVITPGDRCVECRDQSCVAGDRRSFAGRFAEGIAQLRVLIVVGVDRGRRGSESKRSRLGDRELVAQGPLGHLWGRARTGRPRSSRRRRGRSVDARHR